MMKLFARRPFLLHLAFLVTADSTSLLTLPTNASNNRQKWFGLDDSHNFYDSLSSTTVFSKLSLDAIRVVSGVDETADRLPHGFKFSQCMNRTHWL